MYKFRFSWLPATATAVIAGIILLSLFASCVAEGDHEAKDWGEEAHKDEKGYYDTKHKYDEKGAEIDNGGKGHVKDNGKIVHSLGHGTFRYSKGEGKYFYKNFYLDKGGNQIYVDNGGKRKHDDKGYFDGKGDYKRDDHYGQHHEEAQYEADPIASLKKHGFELPNIDALYENNHDKGYESNDGYSAPHASYGKYKPSYGDPGYERIHPRDSYNLGYKSPYNVYPARALVSSKTEDAAKDADLDTDNSAKSNFASEKMYAKEEERDDKERDFKVVPSRREYRPQSKLYEHYEMPKRDFRKPHEKYRSPSSTSHRYREGYSELKHREPPIRGYIERRGRSDQTRSPSMAYQRGYDFAKPPRRSHKYVDIAPKYLGRHWPVTEPSPSTYDSVPQPHEPTRSPVSKQQYNPHAYVSRYLQEKYGSQRKRYDEDERMPYYRNPDARELRREIPPRLPLSQMERAARPVSYKPYAMFRRSSRP